MADAASTLKLGVTTGEALAELQALRNSLRETKTVMAEMGQTQSVGTGGLAGLESGLQGIQNELVKMTKMMDDLTKNIGRGTAKAYQEAASEAERSADKQIASIKRVSASYRENLAQGFAVSFRMDEKSLRAAAFGPTREMFDKAVADQNKALSKMLGEQEAYLVKKESLEAEAEAKHRAEMLASTLKDEEYIQRKLREQEAYLVKKESLEAEAEAKHRAEMLASTLKDEEYIQRKLREQEAYLAKKAALEREAEAVHRQIMFEGMLKDAQTEHERTKNAEREAYARMQTEALFMNRVMDLRAAAEERNRVMNARFMTASVASQARIANEAAAYLSLGGDATARYGTLASDIARDSASLAALNAQLENHGKQHDANAPKINRTTGLMKTQSEAMRDAHAAARGLAGGFNQLWLTYGAILPLVAGAAVGGTLAGVVRVGKDVEFQLQFLRALADDFERQPINLDRFLQISGGTVTSVKDAAEGMRQLSQAGLDQQRALAALPDVLNLAVIGEMGVGQAALTATGVVNAFNLTMSDTSKVGDIFAKVAAASNTSVLSMTESMKQASTVGEQFHVSIEEASATMGVLAQRNIMGTSAGTALTTALKNLYEPSRIAEKSLAQVGLTTKDASGGLKGFTQLIGELREKMLTMNESSRAVFLGSITDQRGAKALSALTENWDKYKDMLFETQTAAGFMTKAVLQLEDTVEKSNQRMVNSMQVSFVKAFAEAEPEIRQVQESLIRLFKSDEFVTAVTTLSVGVTRLTEQLVKNGDTVLMLIGSYMAFKGVTYVVTFVEGLTIAMRAKTAATIAATEANAALTASEIAAANAQIPRAAGALSLGAGLRMVTGVLGPLAILVTSAYAAWELYDIYTKRSDEADRKKKGSTDGVTTSLYDQERAQLKLNNTADLTIDYYDRQIQKLKQLNFELEQNAKKAQEAIQKTTLAQLQSQMVSAQLDLDAAVASKSAAQKMAEASRNQVRTSDGSVITLPGKGNMPTDTRELNQSITAVEAAQAKLEALQGRIQKLAWNDISFTEASSKNLILKSTADATNQVDRLISEIQGNPKTKNRQDVQIILKEAYSLKDQLTNDEAAWMKAGNVITDLRSRLNKIGDTFVKPTGGQGRGKDDAYHAQMKEIDGRIEALRREERSLIEEAKFMLKDGQIGQFQSINLALEAAQKSTVARLEELNTKRATALAHGKKSDAQSAKNEQEKVLDELRKAEREADEKKALYTKKIDDDILSVEKQHYLDRGELVNAFLLDYQHKYGTMLSSISKDLASSDISDSDREKLEKLQKRILDLRSDGIDKADMESQRNEYSMLFNQLQEGLAQVKDTGDSMGGIFGALRTAEMSEEIRNNAIPALQALLDKMAEYAEQTGNTKLKAEVAKFGKDLAQEANKQTNLWRDVGKSIAASLGDAFGKGGKAIAGMIDNLLKYSKAQETIDRELVKKTNGKDPNSPEYIRAVDQARKDSFELQIQSYGDLAGAMKGYFDEHSAGYATLEAIERGFRLVQIALTLEDMYTRLMANTTVTSAVVAGNQMQATSATESAGEIIAAAMAEANASAVAGVANQAQGDPFSAFARMAAMAALMAGLGLAVSGGISGPTGSADWSKQRQKTQNTGTVLGEPDAKSESIDKSLKYLEQNSNIALQHSQGMLAALRSIDDGIEGLGRFVAQSTGISGNPNFSFSGQSFGSWKNGFLGLNTFTRELLDAGLLSTGGKRNLGSMELNPYYSFDRFQQVRETDSGFLGIGFLGGGSETKVDTAPMPTEFNRQVGLIMRDIGRSAVETGKALGISEATMRNRVNNETFWLGDLSTKGMSSSDVEKALQSKFSQMSDLIFKDILPGFERFQKAGEGYSETVMRVATAAESARFKLNQLGISMISLEQLSKTTGDTQTELVRESILRNETVVLGTQRIQILGARIPVLVTRFTNLGEIINNMSGSADDLITTYQQLLDVQERMQQTGQSGNRLSRDTIYGAGGLDRLQSGLRDFQQNFFSDEEQRQFKVDHLRKEFEKIGVAMPTTLDGFKRLVIWFSTLPGDAQKTYGKLITLSSEFADAFKEEVKKIDPEELYQKAADRVNELADSVKRFHDASKSAQGVLKDIDKIIGGPFADSTRRINDLMYGLKNQIGTMTVEQQLDYENELMGLIEERYNTEKDNAQKLIDFGKELNEYVNGLTMGDLSPLTNSQKLAQAQQEYQDTLAKARAGDQDAMGQLQGKADSYLKLSKDFFASSGQYNAIFDDVYGAIKALATSTGQAGQSAKDAAEKERTDALKEIRKAAMNTYVVAEQAWIGQKALLEAALIEERKQAIALGKISMVPDILASMPADIARQMASLYPNLQYVKGDSTKSNFPQQKPWTSMTQAERNAVVAQAVGINGSHADGLDYVPFDGYMAMLHKGEKVLTAARASGREEALLAEMQAMLEAINRLRQEQHEQTAAILQAQYDSTDRAAGKVVDGQKESAETGNWQHRSAAQMS